MVATEPLEALTGTEQQPWNGFRPTWRVAGCSM
jgi:hypothetical protein